MLNNITTLMQLVFRHHEWWREADDIAVCGLGEQAIIAEFEADIPCRIAVFGIIDDDGIEDIVDTFPELRCLNLSYNFICKLK